MSELRMELERVETMVQADRRHLREAEGRLEALEQAVLELAASLRQLGEELFPNQEKELSEDP